MVNFTRTVYAYLCLYILASVCSSFTLALSKNWIQSNDWETKRNWNLQRLPCASDIVKITAVNGEIFLNSTTRIKGLSFPRESSIVLGESAELVFTEENSDSKACEGGDISFTGCGSSDWFDPTNWQNTKFSEIGLYTQQIPCQYDVVTFPKDSSYSVKISKNVTVANVFINGKKQSESEFRQYISTHTGVQQIQLNESASFHITGKECLDVTGCVCDNTKHEDYICPYVTCPKLNCDKRVKPFGGCCSICGSLLFLNFTDGFKKASLEKKIQNYLKKFSEVEFISTKFEEQRIQIVLWEVSSSDSTKTASAAHSIRENLLEDETMHVVAVEILPKGSSVSPEASKSTGVNAVTIGSIIAGVVAFIVLITLFIIILFKYKRSRPDLVVREDGNGGIPNVENDDDIGVNPLYESSDLEMGTLGFTNALAVTVQGKGQGDSGQENPLYEPAKAAI